LRNSPEKGLLSCGYGETAGIGARIAGALLGPAPPVWRSLLGGAIHI
jgi:hypothetical protein